MKIGEVAKLTGLTVKSIRYYHDIDLVPASRNENGYRDYQQREIDSLLFIHHCRELGFSLDDCRALLDLKQNSSRNAQDVKALARQHLHDVNAKITKLQTLQTQLTALIDDCKGGQQPNCAILTGLSGVAK